MEQSVTTDNELTPFAQVKELLPLLTKGQLQWLRMIAIPEQMKVLRGVPKPPASIVGTKALSAQIPVL